jgi:X-X-X-Leu-X-X-Gly heptad repeat protein
MRHFNYVFAVAAMGSFMALAQTGSASPLASGLGSANSGTPAIADGLVQKVHGWHCSRKWSKRLGKHRHRKACYKKRYYDDDYYYDDYYDYSYYRPYRYYAYPYYPGPFIGFSFGDDDDGRRRGRRGRDRED